MKNFFLVALLFSAFYVQKSFGQCNGFFQYTLGNCPTVMFFDASTTSSGSINSWTYDFGDGNTSTQQNPAHTYSANGTYLICLTIGTDNGCSDTYCDTINVNCITPPSCQTSYQYTLGACPTVSFFDASASSPGSINSWIYDFGDGTTSTQQNPSHTYAANGTYMVCLTTTSTDGCTDTYCDTINISCITPPSCQTNFQYTLGACPTVMFFDGSTSSPGSINSWNYDFGDGNTSTQQNPSHTYAANGTYLVCLTTTSTDGCTNTHCDTITVNCITPPGCQTNFQYTTAACPTVAFFDASTSAPGSVNSWIYDFGDGTTSTQQNPNHTYSTNGTYVVCLTTTSTDGCTDTHCDTITVNCITPPACQAGFTWNGCPTVSFTDVSTASPGSVTSWLYDFGDGNTSTQQNPVHAYSADGMYLACLVITTSDGCTSTYCDTINVNCLTPSCQAGFNWTGCPTVSFTDNSTASPGAVTSWIYDFGDGNTSTQQNPVHVYNANGMYLACLTITTANGCTSTYCDTISINCLGGNTCQAEFSYTGCPSVAFTDLSVSTNGNVVSWIYDFGDGGTSTMQNPVHVYNADGSYLACLTITTTNGCTSTYCDTVVVNCLQSSCDAEFSYDMSNCPAVNFTDLSTSNGGDPIGAWMYDFGNGDVSTSQNPSYTYTSNGTYVVCMQAVTINGSVCDYCDTIVVNCIVGMDEWQNQELDIYPNPVQGELFIEGVDSSVDYFIYSMEGKLVGSGITAGRIAVNNLSKGVYLIEVRENGARLTTRFIKN